MRMRRRREGESEKSRAEDTVEGLYSPRRRSCHYCIRIVRCLLNRTSVGQLKKNCLFYDCILYYF
jgi:hypothetical protein